MTKFIFDGVEYEHNRMNDNVFYKAKYMGKYQNINGNKIHFVSAEELKFHCILKKNTNKKIIQGKSLLNQSTETIENKETILSLLQKYNENFQQ